MEEIRRYGFVATPRKARSTIVCFGCQGVIRTGEVYYRVTVVGAGVRGFKFPDRIHAKCVDAFLDRYKVAWEARMGG